ncbi:Stk1 family PASTA domain-containing Ser/Thr kinase [Corynebacterium pygosceleis]|uniref:non-specific serine/threonine protein kinase n=2 Tax=Corynebacterium pygosceleis TaxID=2800406 RepID=A0A9Q4GLJ7_9CORY|nr:Stk1 family PASTA domain-containing Ser/Thr kinase [Corynebacterium pygosceleis]MCX7445135.1 Stk1 family PASTA domain-containing Ser/Thr kinase [Corynebacterium pygosceleis]MCX7468440.1 Stk1 family PASTA domain-containing Ser/Thr kinase [Corynebacterium pygosceleis]
MNEHVLGERYELGEVIGTGGMSDVYAAKDTLLGRDVAVKMMRAELARDVNFRERFRREAQNAGRLNHPSIVSVLDTGETELNGIRIPYIVMERVHGRTLREIVQDDGPMRPAEAARTLLPVCEALQFSHEAGIVHRDIKPANIMITNTGSVKVMDFGIARAVDDATSAMTQTSAVIGTAQYLSPEQARGKSADARSDVYALGCVLYETVTGRPPFEGESPFAVAFNHVHEDPEPPSSFIPDLTPTAALNVDAVVLLTMAKHPADRYQSAAELAEDLTRLGRNAVSNAARSHMRPMDAEEPDRTRVNRAADSTAVTRRTTAAPGAVPSSADTDTPRPVPATRRRRSDEGPRYADDGRSGNRGVWIGALLGLVAVAGASVVAFNVFTGDGAPGQNSGAPVSVNADGTVTIPDVEGKKLAAARTSLEQLDLRVNVTMQPSPDVADGVALSTNPGSGSMVQPGSTVTLLVSSGTELTAVPHLSDLNTEEAERILVEAGLGLDPVVREESSDTVPEGRVTEQDPPADRKVPKGSKIKITVSTGPELIAVPDFSGQPVEQVRQRLEGMDLVPVVQSVASDLPAGQVTSIGRSGTEVRRGTPVTVQVSDGSMFRIPDLTGMDVNQALAALRAAGWTSPDTSLLQQPVQTGALIESGQIEGQTPLPGELTGKDALVSIRVKQFNLLKVIQP